MKSVGLVLGLAVGLISTAAFAEEPKAKGDLIYEFKDPDLLNANQLGGNTAQIHVLGKKNRELLHRPRLNFVPELLKSVENM